MNILISTAYFGPINYYANIHAAKDIFIEGFEHFPKQTYRNRCLIYGANGPLSLSVPVSKGNVLKVYTNEIKIDYSFAWQKNHLRAIESAYRCAPYYQYYIDELVPFFDTLYEFLFDFNIDILIKTCNLLGLHANIKTTDSFQKIAPADVIDLRYTLHPKTNKDSYERISPCLAYRQVFEPKFGFIENLSILDLLFNTGPDAIHYLVP